MKGFIKLTAKLYNPYFGGQEYREVLLKVSDIQLAAKNSDGTYIEFTPSIDRSHRPAIVTRESFSRVVTLMEEAL